MSVPVDGLRARRVLLVALAVVTGALTGPLCGAAPAAAHASLLSTDPVDGAVLEVAPEQLTLTFDEPVQIREGGIRLLDATGADLQAESRSVDALVEIAVPPELPDGTYVLSWRVVSQDSHPVAGGLTFSIGAPSAGVVDLPEAEPSRALRSARQAGEALGYVGVLASAGLIVFLLALLPGGGGGGVAVRRRLRALLLGCVAVAGVAAVAAVPLTVAWQDGADLAAVLRVETWREGLSTDTALSTLLILAGLASATAAVGLAGREPTGGGTTASGATAGGATAGGAAASGPARRRWVAIVAFAGAALAVGAFAVVGHTRTVGPAWLLLTVDLLHLSTAAVWFGGLLGLAVTLARCSDTTPVHAAESVARFSRLAAGLVVGLGLAGVVMGARVLYSWSALWNTSYGTVLLVKVAVALLVLPIAGYNRFRLVPAIGSGDGDRPGAWLRLRRTVRAEALLLIVVLSATGVLVTQSPREEPQPQPEAATATSMILETELGTGQATIALTPGQVGVNSLELTMRDEAGRPLEPVDVPELSVTMPDTGIGPLERPLSRTGPGQYQAVADFPLAGGWVITLSVRTSRYENPVVQIPLEIP